MCVALPGRVLSVDGSIATVDFSGSRREANIGLVRVSPGDYVLVHAGLVIQTLKQQDAEEIAELMGLLEETE